jgi:hypothetical protein
MGDHDEGSQESMAMVAPVSLDRFKVMIKHQRKIAVVVSRLLSVVDSG